MNLKKFVNDYLKDSAIITINNSFTGEIMFYGLVAKMPDWIYSKNKIVGIRGLGMYDDIIIEVIQED